MGRHCYFAGGIWGGSEDRQKQQQLHFMAPPSGWSFSVPPLSGDESGL